MTDKFEKLTITVDRNTLEWLRLVINEENRDFKRRVEVEFDSPCFLQVNEALDKVGIKSEMEILR